MAATTTGAGKAAKKTSAEKNLELLQKVKESGGQYVTTHAAHEKRAYELSRQGYLKREWTLVGERRHFGEIIRTYRWAYTLTDKGLAKL